MKSILYDFFLSHLNRALKFQLKPVVVQDFIEGHLFFRCLQEVGYQIAAFCVIRGEMNLVLESASV